MEVKKAVETTKKYIVDLYADERIAPIGLEEVAFDDAAHVWEVMIGFFRPWDKPQDLVSIMVETVRSEPRDRRRRSFEVVEIDDRTG